jgi:uncharacterized protein (TIGR02996 family)
LTNPVEAIEARIRANEADSEAWRVYADWLLDRGDRRGELIGLELLPESSPELRDKIAMLVGKYRRTWEPPALPVKADYEWRYGFVTAVTITDIAQPRQVRSLERLLSDPQARLLSRMELSFRGRTSGTKLFKPLAELDLGKLRWFRTYHLDSGDKLVRALVQQPSWRLHTLALRRTGLTNEGAIDLAHCAQLSGLRRLYLANNAIGGLGVAALANAPTLSQLEELELLGNEIGLAGAKALAASPFLARMERLYADVDEEGKRALASSFSPNPNSAGAWTRRR